MFLGGTYSVEEKPMRIHQQSTWLYGMTALLAAIGLALASAGCEPTEGVYEGSEEEAVGVQQEQQAQDQQPQVGVEQEPAEQQQQAAQQQDDISLENLEPSQVSDQDLGQFARAQLKLNLAREDAAVGGGPVEDQELEEWETEMIQNSGMDVDKYLAIRMMLQDEPELQQRYEQVVEQIHEQPDQQQPDQQQPDQQQPDQQQ
jgi:hypothetical protein